MYCLKHLKRKSGRLLSSSVGAVLALGVGLPLAAHAIPPGQRDVDGTAVATTSTTFRIVPNSVVTVNNGTTARNCVIQFSADVAATTGDGMNLRYAIDSTDPSACSFTGGPLFFLAGGLGGGTLQTRTAVHVINIPAGIHTIRPCFALRDINGGGGSTFFGGQRTLTVECNTQ